MKKVSCTASVAPDAELALYSSIRSLVLSARNTVARGVDLVQVRTHFEIGRHIVECGQQGEALAAYGKELLALLAERLTAEFGKGFGRSNIACARSFYLAYQARRPIVQTASGQSERQFILSWSHYVFLLGIKKTDERDFYEIEATSQDRARTQAPVRQRPVRTPGPEPRQRRHSPAGPTGANRQPAPGLAERAAGAGVGQGLFV